MRNSVRSTSTPPTLELLPSSRAAAAHHLVGDARIEARLQRRLDSIAQHPSLQGRADPSAPWMARALADAEMRAIFVRLSSHERAVVELIYFRHMDLPQIAERLGRSLAFVCRQCVGALLSLQRELRIIREPVGTSSAAEHLTVLGQRSRGVVWLELTGRVDVGTIPLLDEWLLQAERGADSRIVVDFAGVTSVDPAGLNRLALAEERAHGQGILLVFIHCAEALRLLLRFGRDRTASARIEAQQAAAATSLQDHAGWPPMLIPQQEAPADE